MRLIFLVVLSLLLPLTLQGGPVNQKNDFQFWSTQRLAAVLSPQVTFYIENEYRWGDDASELFYCYVQTGLQLTLWKGFILGPSYRQIVRDINDFDSQKIRIYAPFIDAIFFRKFNEWDLQNRARFEFLLTPLNGTLLLYRNRFQIISPWKLGRMKLIPYMSEEPFFVEYIGFHENRLIFGGKCFPFSGFEVDFYYMLRYHKSLDLEGVLTWRPINVAGLLFYFNF